MLSSTEAEFINLIPISLIAIWIANILKEASYPQKISHILFTDSANILQIAIRLENTTRTKYINIYYK